MPHKEGDKLDPKSRHKGKHETENYLSEMGLPWTSIRPVYIYGPGNYNDLEAWFFDRLVRNRPIPIPGHGEHFTQYRYVTFNGLAKACAAAMGKNAEEIEIVNYNPKKFDFGKKKPFPLRVQHFYADINKATRELNWQPEYDLVSGLTDSFQNDYLAAGRDQQEIDLAIDDQILANQ